MTTATFSNWLVDNQGTTRSTAVQYARIVASGLRAGDPMLAVLRARCGATRKAAWFAIRRYVEFSGDRKLGSRLDATRGVTRERQNRPLNPATENELAALDAVHVDEPYRSALTLASRAHLRVSDLFAFTREQADIALVQPVPLVRGSEVVGWWKAGPACKEALRVLLQYGGWECVRDLWGRDYATAYRHLRDVVDESCAKAGIRRLRPGQFAA